MQHPAQARRRRRQSRRRGERDGARRSGVRTAIRRARGLVEAGKQEEAETAVRAASAILDRAANKGILHPNNAARRKSRLARHLVRGPTPETGPSQRGSAKKTSSRSAPPKKS